MKATLNIDYTQSFGNNKGNLKGMTFEVVEQVAGRTTLDIFGRHTDFYGKETTLVVEKPTFENSFLFESMADLREIVAEEFADTRTKFAKELGMCEGLFTSKWGELIVVDEEGSRLEGFEDPYDIKGSLPTKKEIKEVYNDVVGSGATNFRIVFEALIRCWDSYSDKFAGYGAEPTSECATVTVLSSIDTHPTQLIRKAIEELVGEEVTMLHSEAGGYAFNTERGWDRLSFAKINSLANLLNVDRCLL
jgi:hypothetical protein